MNALLLNLRSQWARFNQAGLANTRGESKTDIALWMVVIFIACFGLVMVYSSSIALAEASKATSYRAQYFVYKQAAFLAIGFACLWITTQIPMSFYYRFATPLFFFILFLCAIVMIPKIGVSANGSRRWLALPGFAVQPSELLKLTVIFFTARYAVLKYEVLNHTQAMKTTIGSGLLPILGVLVLTGTILILQPDYGATVVVLAIAFGILFLANLDFRLLVPIFVIGFISFAILIWTAPYRVARWLSFLDPFADELGKGYQLTHSLMAFGRGGITGVGLGGSIEKLLYLPEAHTDFILAVIGEELGLIGVSLVIGLFAWLTWRAMSIGKRANDLQQPFLALVAQGVGLWIGVQALINIAVNVGALPTKGLTLPLMSYGGTGLITNLIAMGVLIRVDIEVRRLARGYGSGVGQMNVMRGTT
jgi:cell division protein FtsW